MDVSIHVRQELSNMHFRARKFTFISSTTTTQREVVLDETFVACGNTHPSLVKVKGTYRDRDRDRNKLSALAREVSER